MTSITRSDSATGDQKIPTPSHTPGPWRLSGPDYFGNYTIQPPDMELAIAAAVNGEMRRMGGKTAEQEANARLIAAAPDMLAALRMAADTIHSYHGDQTSYDGWQNEEVRDVWLAARAAIAKVTGEA